MALLTGKNTVVAYSSKLRVVHFLKLDVCMLIPTYIRFSKNSVTPLHEELCHSR